MYSINLVEQTLQENTARQFIDYWAEKKKISPIEVTRQGYVYYPFYYAETETTIKRVFRLPPRVLKHRWLMDAITGRPFMIPDYLGGKDIQLAKGANKLEPVINFKGMEEKISRQAMRHVMRYYKYLWTPDIKLHNLSLLHIWVWIFGFKDKFGKERFIGVNSWSGNIMELED